jgi:MFS family permease
MNRIKHHEHSGLRRAVRQGRSFAALLPMMAAVFVAYLVIGIAMPVLPVHVHHGLGLSTFVVGLVAGSQFAASLISRLWAGHQADIRGAKYALVAGLLAAAASGLLYLLSLGFLGSPLTSVTILLLGRALLGGAESFIVLGALNWGLAIAGPQNTGMVMAQIGTAMYLAYAIGAPAGSALYGASGFGGIALATSLIPIATLLFVAPLRAVAPSPHTRPAFTKVIGAVWVPGLGLALSAVGFGAITTFVVLLFAQHGWGQAWLALTVLSVAFAGGRIVFGHLPDKIGGTRVALVCALIEAAGQALIWLAPSSAIALIGCALSGFGYSLVYPGFGVEAVRRAPPENRGLAVGAYTACLDLALGLASPALGLVASGAGLAAVFLASAFVVFCAALIALLLLHARSSSNDRANAGRLQGDADGARTTKMKQTALRLVVCAVVAAARLVHGPLLSDHKAQMAAANGRFGLIIDSAPDIHDLNPYLPSLSFDGTGLVGAEPEANRVSSRQEPESAAGSPTGKILSTQSGACPWNERVRTLSHQRT